jgi:Pentapeptide repeats (8 copies)
MRAELDKLRAEVDKLRVDRDLTIYQTSRTYRILEYLKGAAGVGTVAAAVAGLVTLAVSAWQWNVQQTESRLVRIEERADKALASLGEKEPSARLGAVESLRSFLTQPDELRHKASITNALAIEPEIAVRNAIIAVLQSIDPHVVSNASLDAALVSLRSVSRTLIASGSINRDHPRMQHPLKPPATDSIEGRAQSVGFAIAALLHLGASAVDLTSVYCVECDLTNLNLAGVNFEDSILYLANFEMSQLKARHSIGRTLSRLDSLTRTYVLRNLLSMRVHSLEIICVPM